MKYKIIIILLTALAIIIAGIALFSMPAANIKVTQTDMDQAVTSNGGLITKELTISNGKTFTISLFSAVYAGMRWSGSSNNIDVVRQDGAAELTGGFPFGGRDGEKWTFKANNTGQATISMSYASVGVFDPPKPIVNTLKVIVTVK
ncbi:MAG: protease inhibitor I42 family protein [Dehalogenimonas sp.]